MISMFRLNVDIQRVEKKLIDVKLPEVYPPASMEHAQSLPVVRQKLLISSLFLIEK